MQLPPGPNLAYMSFEQGQRDASEPAVLAAFRAAEEKKLTTYEWMDKSAGTVRIPIDRAKALLLERGLPVRAAAIRDSGGEAARGGQAREVDHEATTRTKQTYEDPDERNTRSR